MAIVLNTVREVLEFLDGFDGAGMISEDEELQLERIRNMAEFFGLVDDTKPAVQSKSVLKRERVQRGEDLYCEKCELPMPFTLDPLEILELHHHCISCNAWQWGSGSGFDGDICAACRDDGQ